MFVHVLQKRLVSASSSLAVSAVLRLLLLSSKLIGKLIQQHTILPSVQNYLAAQFSSKEKLDWPCIQFDAAWSII